MPEQLYKHTRYIWHKMAIRATVMLPIIIVKVTVDKLSEAIDDLFDWADGILPRTYVEEMVEFDKLSKVEKERIKQIATLRDDAKTLMMIQAHKVK